MDDLKAELGRDPTPEEVAKRLESESGGTSWITEAMSGSGN